MSWAKDDQVNLENIATTLDELVAAMRANLLYTADERRTLGIRYNQLREACVTAKAEFAKVQLSDGITWDQLEQSGDPQKVSAMKALHIRARDEKQAADKAMLTFREAHPVLLGVLDQRRDWS